MVRRTSGMAWGVARGTVMRRVVILVIGGYHIEILWTPSNWRRILYVRTVLRRWRGSRICRSIAVLLIEGARVRIRNGLVGRSVIPVWRSGMRVRVRVRRVSVSSIRPRTVLHRRRRRCVASANCFGSNGMRCSENILILAVAWRCINNTGLPASLENHFYPFVIIVADLTHLVLCLCVQLKVSRNVVYNAIAGAGAGENAIVRFCRSANLHRRWC
mmetsp:Transcript_28545/g.77257  ORF Transcript_28545/g.77257 Transcript_28545/m.77257 type:complete len:216 (+) Transcript_28545:2159-2806(+)